MFNISVRPRADHGDVDESGLLTTTLSPDLSTIVQPPFPEPSDTAAAVT